MRDTACERVPLEAVARFEDLGRDRAGRRPRAGGEPGLEVGRQVEPVGGEADRVLVVGRILGLAEKLPHPNERLLPVGRAVDLDPHSVDEVGLRRGETLLEAGRQVGGVGIRRQRDHLDHEPLLRRQLHAAQGRRLAGRVAVEAEPDVARQPRELPQVPVGERGAHRRDDRLDPFLAERDHVRVPLDDDGAVLLRDRPAREVEPVEDGALLEAVALRRVDVLGLQRIVLAQLARLEAEHAPARVGEREDDALREVVVAAAVDEPGGEQLLAGELALMGLLRQRLRARREAEPERAADLLAEPSPGEVRPRVLGAGRIPQAALVERRRRREQLAEPVAPPPLGLDARRRLLVLELDPEAVGEPFDGAGEVEVLRLLDERDQVAAGAAAEAVVELVDRR